MSESSTLYTPELLSLAVELAQYPPQETLPLHGDARSVTCGGTLTIDLAPDAAGRIDSFGMRVRACAVGQAAAAIFARQARGTDAHMLRAAKTEIEGWLQGGPLPEWPGFSAISAAQSYPGRHGAILLPWRAALAALSSTEQGS